MVTKHISSQLIGDPDIKFDSIQDSNFLQSLDQIVDHFLDIERAQIRSQRCCTDFTVIFQIFQFDICINCVSLYGAENLLQGRGKIDD